MDFIVDGLATGRMVRILTEGYVCGGWSVLVLGGCTEVVREREIR
jgi:hypothetical protein